MFSIVTAQEANEPKIDTNKKSKLKQLPDLVITDGDYDQVKPRVRVIVENRGSGASLPCTLKLFAVRHKALFAIEKLEFVRDVPVLAAGARYGTGLDLPKTEKGISVTPAKMVVDSENVVKEYKEDNNEWSFFAKEASNLAPSDGALARSFSPPGRFTASIPRAGRAINSFAQATENERKIKLVGTVRGTIHIKSVHGNNLADFGCKNLVVSILPLGENPPRWRLSRIGTGDFSTRKCSYSIQNVPSGVSFGISLKAEFPKGCDQKVFKPDATFPTKIKTAETLTYDLGVSELACTVAK
jgi:hypothetical protein